MARAMRMSGVDIAILQEMKTTDIAFAIRSFVDISLLETATDTKRQGLWYCWWGSGRSSAYRTRKRGPNNILFELIIGENEQWYVLRYCLLPLD